MNSGTGIAELLVHYREGPDRLDEEVLPALERSFGTILSRLPGSDRPPRLEGIGADPEGVAASLARIIFNFARAEAAGASNAKAVAGIRTRLLEFVQRGIPVEAQMLWSPKKHWMLGTESAVDLAELAALQTLISIDSAVQPVYRAGMSFVIDLEDIEFQFMEGQSEEVVNAREIYMSGMKRLLKALSLDELFTLRRMSERAKDSEELSRWRQQMAENHRGLEAYWYESEEYPVSSRETLASFKEIRRLGWKGTIPPEMRRYYINRLGRLTGASDAEKVDMVLRNLAGILLHHQVDLLRGSGGVCPLKFSFVRGADGATAELLRGRVDLRFAPRRLCSRVSAAAPWATKGFVQGRGNNMRVSFRGWHELADARCQFAEGWFTIAGRDGAAKVRADFMREDQG
jgi:hypothetical protein